LYYIVLHCITISLLPLCGEIKITNTVVRQTHRHTHTWTQTHDDGIYRA